MKKIVFVLGASLFATTTTLSQTGDSVDPINPKATSNTISLGANIPVGEFSETHIAGISLIYSWSPHRFGKLNVLPGKLIGFTANGGIDHYFGKKETVAGYDFKYGGYTFLHVFGGIIYNPSKQTNISLTTGPAMSLYKGNAGFGFGISWNGSYYFSRRIALTPGFIYMKQAEANALWAASLKATYNF
jgi:hypothetical protein